MIRLLLLLATLFPLVTGCNEFPAPAQYDQAMLREYFGKPSQEVADTFEAREARARGHSKSKAGTGTLKARHGHKAGTGTLKIAKAPGIVRGTGTLKIAGVEWVPCWSCFFFLAVHKSKTGLMSRFGCKMMR